MERSDRKTFLRLLSYNIHGCLGSDRRVDHHRTARIIADIEPDLVALQEVDLDPTRGDGRSQAEIIGEQLQMQNVYFPLEKSGRHRYGLAVLSRWPLKDVRFLKLPNLYTRYKLRRRGAIAATLDTQSGPLRLVNTHLSVFKMERRKQLSALMSLHPLQGSNREPPLIVCGDLNAGPASHTYRTLAGLMTDTQQASGATELEKATFHARSPAFRIDHIFVSEHFCLLQTIVKKTPVTAAASDHLPVFADVALRDI